MDRRNCFPDSLSEALLCLYSSIRPPAHFCRRLGKTTSCGRADFVGMTAKGQTIRNVPFIRS
jgi:hypothetical protein